MQPTDIRETAKRSGISLSPGDMMGPLNSWTVLNCINDTIVFRYTGDENRESNNEEHPRLCIKQEHPADLHNPFKIDICYSDGETKRIGEYSSLNHAVQAVTGFMTGYSKADSL